MGRPVIRDGLIERMLKYGTMKLGGERTSDDTPTLFAWLAAARDARASRRDPSGASILSR